MIVKATWPLSEKKFPPLAPDEGSRVCVRAEGLLACGTMHHFLQNTFTFITLFTFSKQACNDFFFANVHTLMNDINLIDGCQAHWTMQYARTSNPFARSVVI